MNGRTNAYLDLVALPHVGAVMLDSRPAFVFRGDGSAVLFANAAGVAFFGAPDVGALLDRRFTKASPFAAHLARLAKSLHADHDRLELLRVSFGVTQSVLPAACRKLDLGAGARAVLAVGTTGGLRESLSTRAERLADAIAGSDLLAAVIDRDGRVLGASGGFDALEPASAALDALILRAERGEDPVVREAVKVGATSRDAGVARVTIGGERLFLLIVGPERAAPAAAAHVPTAPSSKPLAVAEVSLVDETEPFVAAKPNVAMELAAPRTPAPAPPAISSSEGNAEPAQDRIERTPARFFWRTDATGGFTFASPELGEAVGGANAPATGETWRVLASRVALDDNGKVADVLEALASFSDVRVYWPVTGASEAIAVDLSGVPEFARDRTFRGYRGFGAIRVSDRRTVAKVTAAAPTPKPSVPEIKDPARPEPIVSSDADLDDVARERIEGAARNGTRPEATPVPAETPRPAEPARSNVVHISAPPTRILPRRLTGSEEDAFRRIAEALGARVVEGVPAEAATGAAAATEARNGVDTAILDKLPVGIVVYRDSRTLYANRALLDLLGYDDLDGFLAAGGAGAIFPEDHGHARRAAAERGRLDAARRDGTQGDGRGEAPRRPLVGDDRDDAVARPRNRC